MNNSLSFGDLTSQIQSVHVLPMVKYFLDELGLYSIFDQYIPQESHEKTSPAEVLCLLILNILDTNRPFYQIEEWVSNLMGETGSQEMANLYNDDRIARVLDCLYASDRGSMMVELSLRAIDIHQLDCSQIHNDTTTISFSGSYSNDSEGTVELERGHNKDHRPDCKQLVFGLNTTSDGHVPLSYQLYSGNRTDDTTHLPNWEELRSWIQEEEMIYVADSKLCVSKVLIAFDLNGGLFITIMPQTRKEAADFFEKSQETDQWKEIDRIEDSRKKGKFTVYEAWEGEKSEEGFRITWIRSSQKKEQDQQHREKLLEKLEAQLEELKGKLNRYSLKTKEAIEKKLESFRSQSKGMLKIHLIEEKTEKRVQTTRGRVGKQTTWRKEETILYQIRYEQDKEVIENLAKQDGTFPLIDNTDLSAQQLLRTYKQQSFLEKRHATAKSVLRVSPVFLKKETRIEAMLFLHFVSLMILSLIERKIRKNMKIQEIEALAIRPQKMKTKAPTWQNLTYFFRNVHRSSILLGDQVLKTEINGMMENHEQVLDLLGIPLDYYNTLEEDWWKFG